ncbi:MAG TPA: PilT/PilU family type 4a pilus ATPase [Bryobacteraceae bacterium]|nr:PilT/PilU family type 4a pilus ATPase [Bryobacteraceae bacterium]
MAAYDSELARIVEELNRSAPGARVPDRPAATRSPAGTASLDQLLAFAARQGASDLLLVSGSAVALRVNGALMPASGPPLSPEDVRSLVLPLLESPQYEELQRNRTVDFCFAREAIGRFRANIHNQRGTLAASIRLLPARIPSLESLHLPAVLGRLAERRQGLVLVTGPTGCGKTSTLAALIDLINSRRRDHIVTIEDPIEYYHPNRGSIVEQIEVGHDTPDFARSLRSILRQSPDVIFVGEMRDLETMATVLTAAETGHLVFSTLHTNDTAQAVSRILDSFPAANQPQIRQQLSLALAAVVAQQLVPAAGGNGRYPAVEIMMASDAVRNLIRKGDDHQIRTQLTMGRAEGMITMEQSLADLVRAGRILRETAFAHCFRPDELRRQLDG